MTLFGLKSGLKSLVVAGILATGIVVPAQATVLLDLTNPAYQVTQYTFSFVATGPTTTLSFAGYDPPSFESSTQNRFFLDNTGPNLLGSLWSFTAAAQGSNASTFYDGTAVPGLSFGGMDIGYYDTFYQTIATVAGDRYTLHFLYSNNFYNPNPSGFVVSASGVILLVPEPGTLALIGAALLALGAASLRRKRD